MRQWSCDGFRGKSLAQVFAKVCMSVLQHPETPAWNTLTAKWLRSTHKFGGPKFDVLCSVALRDITIPAAAARLNSELVREPTKQNEVKRKLKETETVHRRRLREQS